MAKRRFFFNSAEKKGELAVLDDEESRHITTVLRLSEGEEVELFDGSGYLYTAVLDTMGRKVKARITGSIGVEKENGCTLCLGQAVLKGSKVDELIPKCNELGVDIFTPFESSRCQGRLGEQRAKKKRERWQRIADSSCKQCGRLRHMEVDEVCDFQQMITQQGPCPADELRILFWEEEGQQSLSGLFAEKEYQTVRLILGPEGGFSEEEVRFAAEAGWTSVSLGRRILRAETATVTAVSLVQYLSGNLSL